MIYCFHPYQEPEVKKKRSDGQLDAEIFSDEDFYHHLLRELIEQRTKKSEDPVAMSRYTDCVTADMLSTHSHRGYLFEWPV